MKRKKNEEKPSPADKHMTMSSSSDSSRGAKSKAAGHHDRATVKQHPRSPKSDPIALEIDLAKLRKIFDVADLFQSESKKTVVVAK